MAQFSAGVNNTVRPLDFLRVHHERIEVWILEQAGIQFAPTTAEPNLGPIKK